MLYKEIIVASSEIHIKYINTFCRQKVKFAGCVTPGPLSGIYPWTVDKPLSFYDRIERCLIKITNRHRPLAWSTWVPSYWKTFWISSSSLLLSWPRILPFQFPHQHFVFFRCSFCTCYPISQLIFLDLTSKISFYEYKFVKLFISVLRVSTRMKNLQTQFVNMWIIHNLKMPFKKCLNTRFCSWNT